jgi:hypothetical protein
LRFVTIFPRFIQPRGDSAAQIKQIQYCTNPLWEKLMVVTAKTVAQTAFFKVDPRLAALLGETYRSSELAIKELVDNSWDADAENVWITLPAIVSGEPIIVRDDGTGMTEQEVRSEYLSVARDRTSAKGEFTSHYKRPVKGRRGIGKFAGLMVADQMTLQTCARGRSTRLEMPRNTLATAARDLEKDLNQRLTFPDEERLKQLLVLEYGREDHFAIWVNDGRVTVDDIPGQQYQYETVLQYAGPVRLLFKVSPEKKPLRHHGIALRVRSKIVGRPRLFGLDDDPDVPKSTLKRLYGEVIADKLIDEVTADWSAIVENSKGYAELENFVCPFLKEQLQRTFRQDFAAQHARVQREINRRLSQLPENRRQYATKAIERIMHQFYGEKEERIQSIVSVVLDALEHDEYWQVLREIERTSKSEVQLFAESLGNFGLVEIALIGRQAQSRLRFLDFLDQLAANASTREKEMHTAFENNLWVLGSDFSLLNSNATLKRIVLENVGVLFNGPSASTRPDLLLLSGLDPKHVLVEFKRPSHIITRDDQLQAEKYRDNLAQFRPMDIVLMGKDHDPAMRSDRPHYIRLISYAAAINKARTELDWLLKELTDVRHVWNREVT